MSGPALPVRIEISHLVTDAPTWIQEWDGTRMSTSFHPNAAPDAGNLEDWGGYTFSDAWQFVFCDYLPEEVAEEMIDLHRGAGFNARLLPSDRE